MTLTGHKTCAVFDGYHIVSPADRQDLARKLNGITSGTVDASSLDARAVSRENSSTRLSLSWTEHRTSNPRSDSRPPGESLICRGVSFCLLGRCGGGFGWVVGARGHNDGHNRPVVLRPTDVGSGVGFGALSHFFAVRRISSSGSALVGNDHDGVIECDGAP